MAVYRLFGFSVLTACVYGFSLWSTRHPSFSSSRLLTWATKGRLTGNNHGMKAEKSAAEIGFTDMFHDCLEEEEGKDLEVIGEIPPSVSGILVRNGPALFGSLAENGKRYGHIFDGLAKLARFSIKDGKVNFSTKFIRSKWHQKMIGERSDIPPSITTGPVKPPFSTSEKIRAALTASSTFDNVPVNVHQIGGKPDGPWVATTDAPVMMEFDINSLETKGRKKVSPKLTSIGGVELFSTAHPCVRNGKSYNYLLEYKPLSGKNQAHIISIDAQGDRKIVGTVELEPWEIPYIHMISVTENFAVLCIWPLQISMSKTQSPK